MKKLKILWLSAGYR